ncbi:hypothetical protein Poly51_02350 [Rubripirellula tenax]|uniref:DUF4303 domain-containing protein n=1 Tax=Rubripirellula tenax TaxID=2528015 RepID=A0A5C6FJW5_9BACT|nr:hypothetical protein [Rubripirellula tenax]TWU59962.1 hypothetical protein Poly51_02350 [Rubripirellula tenax]
MNLDLPKFVAPIAAEIVKRCEEFDSSTNDGPGDAGDPIEQITLGFQFDQDAWVALVFDTRSSGSAAFDGNWQLHIEENRLDCDCDIDEWLDAYESLFDEEIHSAVTVTTVDGDSKVIEPHSEPDDDGEAEERITNLLAGLIGDALRDALLSARDKGVFDGLPLAPSCVLRIDEHSNGAYCWPDPDTRGTDADEGRLKM